MQQPLGGGARVLAGVVVLVGSLIGTVLSFYALGAVVDLLVDRGTVVCGETVGCGIGVGFLLVLTGVAALALGAVAAIVLPFVLPARWSTARAVRCAAAVAGGVVLLATLAMLAVWLSGAGGDPPPRGQAWGTPSQACQPPCSTSQATSP